MHSRDASMNGLRILSLDGGDAQCMSELELLATFMDRVEANTGMKLRPCGYFDLIVGTGAAGFVAVLLVLFGMTVEEAMEEFVSVYTKVFESATQTTQQRAEILQEAVKGLLRRDNFNIKDTARLQDVAFGGKCKVAICYSANTHMDKCRLFTNFGMQSDYQATIVEVICASWAIPGMISPAMVGPKDREEQLFSAPGYVNPTPEAITASYMAFGAEHRVSCLISLGCGKRGVLSIDTDDPESIRSLGSRIATNPDRIAEEVQRRIGRLKVYHRFSVDHGLEDQVIFSPDFGRIKTHTDAYISQQEIEERLERCVRLSETSGTVAMERLYRSRANAGTSSHGLPPLSAFFVMRRKPIEAMEKGLLDEDGTQRIMLLSGLGGSGKTQLALKFARDHESRFQHILFIDASSEQSIESGMIARVRSIDPDCDATTIDKALEVLAGGKDPATKDWLVIFDNADDPKVKLSTYIPLCDHGAILITSRNVLLDNLAPNAHYGLEAMAPEEAIDALVAAIFPSKASSKFDSMERSEDIVKPTMRDRVIIALIAERLGYLPIAIIQAGCYIRQKKCPLNEYISRLDANRKLLARPSLGHRDRLRYDHSVYAAFDCSLKALAPRALQLLSVLSFFHFANFPQPLFSIASKSNFLYDPYDLLDRPPEFHQAAHLLTEILCPDGEWEDDHVDDLLQELQQYSLVTLVLTPAITTLRFHPLAHGWARDRMSTKDQAIHRAAAVRLLTCGTSWDNDHIFEYLAPHISVLADFDTLHANDRAAMSQVMRHEKKGDVLLQTWKRIYKDVLAIHGRKHLRTTRAALGLGDAYGEHSDTQKMEELERDVVTIREEILGRDHEETLTARSNLARTLCNTQRYSEAEELQKDTLRIRIQTLGIWNKDTALSLEDLSATYHNQHRYVEEQALVMGAVEIRTKVSGRSHVGTIGSIEVLAECHQLQGHTAEAEKLVREAVKLRREVYGIQHLVTVGTMTWLARRYHEQERYEEAEELRREEVEIRTRVQGEQHYATLHGMFWLGHACYGQGKFSQAVDIWEKVLHGMKANFGSLDANTLSAMHWAAKAYYEQGKYTEAAKLWEDNLKGRKEALGDQDSKTFDTMHCLAGVYADMGQHGKAADLRRGVYEGRLSALGLNSKGTANAMYWMAQSLFQQNEQQDAEKWTLEALGIMKEVQGSGDPDTLRTMHALSLIYAAQGRHEDAAKSWEEELKLRQEIFGDDISTLATIHFLAQSYHEMGRYDTAEALRLKEIECRRKVQGEHHEFTDNAIDWLIQAQMAQGKWEKAESWAKSLVSSKQQALGDNHPDTLEALHKLALFYTNQERHAEAALEWQKVLDRYKKSSTNKSRWILDMMSHLAIAYDTLQLYDESIAIRGDELDGRKKLQGEQDADVLEVMAALSRSCLEAKQYEDAEKWAAELLQSRRKSLGNRHTSTLEAIHGLGEMYYRQGRYDRAIPLWKEELKTRKEELEIDDQTLSLMQWLAGACYQQKQYSEAEEILAEEVNIRKKMKGSDDPLTLRAMHWRAQCCFHQNRYRDAELLWKEELQVRKRVQDVSEETLSVLHNIARACLEDGRDEEARTIAKEALDVQREVLGPDDPIYLETVKLLQSIDAWSASSNMYYSGDGPVYSSDAEDGPYDPIDEDGPQDLIDEDGPEAVDVESRTTQSGQRTLFSRGMRPVASTRQLNSWSMLF